MYYLHSGLLLWRVILSSFFLTHGMSKWERLFAEEIKFFFFQQYFMNCRVYNNFSIFVITKAERLYKILL